MLSIFAHNAENPLCYDMFICSSSSHRVLCVKCPNTTRAISHMKTQCGMFAEAEQRNQNQGPYLVNQCCCIVWEHSWYKRTVIRYCLRHIQTIRISDLFFKTKGSKLQFSVLLWILQYHDILAYRSFICMKKKFDIVMRSNGKKVSLWHNAVDSGGVLFDRLLWF